MAFRDFTFPGVEQALGLTLAEADLFRQVPPLELSPEFKARMERDITRSPLQSLLTAPVVAIAEAKNDNLRTGLAQCIAAMVAAREFNTKASPAAPTGGTSVYGAVTTGSEWKFLRLSGSELTLDLPEYFITEMGRILGILAHVIKNA